MQYVEKARVADLMLLSEETRSLDSRSFFARPFQYPSVPIE
jgi:hypothetical protein